MSDQQKYTSEDIKLYLEGKLSPAQMHALEKAAMEDPFLADALEGMEVYSGKNSLDKFSADIDDLKSRLKRKREPVNILWWKIAAVLLIIITGVYIIIYTGEKNKTAKNEIAKKESVVPPQQKPMINPDSEASSIHPNTESTSINLLKESDQSLASQKNSNQSINALKTSKESIASLKDSNKSTAPLQYSHKRELESDVVNAQAVPKNLNKESKKQDVAFEPERNEVQKQQRIDSAVSQKAAASSAPTAEVLQGKAAGLDLTEVVVVGYGNSKRRQADSKPLSEQKTRRRVMPENGWESFEKYIADSARINNSDSLIRGSEKLSFVIDSLGRPSSISIIKSLSTTHDIKAIRLIEEGPSWKVNRGTKRNITLSIIF